MNTAIRHSLSAAIGLGLLSFTITSGVVAGAFASATVLGFALLAAYGVGEIAVLSYATPHAPRTRREVAIRSVPSARPAPGVVVAFPVHVPSAARAA